MTKTFDFLFDVAGPNGYLVHKVLPQFCAVHGAQARYVPVLLGGLMKATGNQPPMVRFKDTPAKWAYEQLEFQRFIARHGLSRFRMNPHFPVNSLLAMRAIVAAGREGRLLPAVDAAMDAMWEEGVNLADPEAARAAFDKAGLDGAKLLEMAEDPSAKAELAGNTEEAVRRGAFGIPTFFVGGEMFWGKERLDQLAEALA